jgi:hypothetical protein
MTVTIYRSTDGSAPVLTGQVGTLVTVLDAVLVNGYGAKAAAGWAKSYSGTNTATYRMGAGTQFYLHVSDNAPATAKEARVWGSETASAVLTGTNLFPTVAQASTGVFARKSTTADATARAWAIAADDRTMYMFVLTADLASCYLGWGFGDFAKQGTDSYNCQVIGRDTENSATTTTSVERFPLLGVALTTVAGGHYIARPYTGIVGALNSGVHADSVKMGGVTVMGAGGTGALQYLNGIDGGLYLSPLWIHETGTQTLRGRLRGLWGFCHNAAAVSDGDTFSGTGSLAGRTFLILKASGSSGLYVVETSDPWDT